MISALAPSKRCVMATKKTATKKTASAKKKAPVPTVEPRPAPPVGAAAPDFTLPADDGSEVSLAELRGSKVVLYFYPKDNTPGCTVEAQGFRDLHDELAELGAVVLGVSRDSVRTHAGFRDKHELPFRLLSDPSAETIAAYGSWGEKKFMGRTSIGILRTTVIIDEEGTIAKIYPKVATKTHAAQVREDLEAL